MLVDEVDAFGVFRSELAMLDAAEAPLTVRPLLKLARDRDDREKVWVMLDRTWSARDDLDTCDVEAI
jgi:hypothetical protein